MASMNIVVLCGNLTRDPDLKFIPNGQAVVKFSMAMNRSWKNASGEKKEEVCFANCTAWGKIAESVGEYLRKGSPVLIEGRLQSRTWEQEGQKRYALDVLCERVQFLGGKKAESGSSQEPSTVSEMQDEDIPF